jgi:hypothetical protein
MNRLLTVCVVAALPGLALGGDKKSSASTTQPIAIVALQRKEPVTYEKDIEPILENKCAFCHSGNVKEGKFDLGAYETLMKGGGRGQPIVPGKSADSLLVKLAGKTMKPTMPPKREEPLTPEELALIKLWVDQGAKPPAGARERPRIALAAPPAVVHPVRALAFGPNKALMAVARGNHVDLYEPTSGKHVRALVDPGLAAGKKPVEAAHVAIVDSLAFSPDSKTLATGSFQEVGLWEVESGRLRQKITGFDDCVVALAYSPDGKYLATGGGAPTVDGEIKLFDAQTGKLVTAVKNGHSDTVFGVSFSPDSTKLATCGADKFVKVFEVPGGKFLKAFEGHTHHVLDVAWRQDGKMLASAGADNVVKLWDYEKGEQVRTIQAHGKQVTRLVFVGKTGQFITCSGDQQVRMWNADNGGNVRNFGGSTGYLFALGVSPDGNLVATGGQEGIVRLYNGTNGQQTRTLMPPGSESAPPRK